MLSSADVTLNLIKMNKFSLKMIDKSLEEKYSQTRIKKTIKMARFFAVLLLTLFGIYAIIDAILEIDGSVFIKLAYLAVFIVFFIFTVLLFTQVYENHYYKLTFLILFLIVTCKIAFDWNSEKYDIILSGCLVVILNTVNLSLPIIWVVYLNVIYGIVFIIRVIILYFSGSNNEIFVQYDLYGNISLTKKDDLELIRFFLSWSCIILYCTIGFTTSYINFKVNLIFFCFN